VAIKTPSDLVLDVAAAAHPAKLREATERLAKTGSETSGQAFDEAMQAAAARKTPAAASPARTASAGRQVIPANDDPFKPAPKGQAEALEKFEAFFLQSFIQEILPKDAANVYGSGLAGDVWRSMLAEQIAAQVAHSTKFGIAERLANNHFVTGKTSATSGGALMNHEAGRKNVPFLQDRQAGDALSTGLLAAGGAAVKRS
jgi:hypothetical protein